MSAPLFARPRRSGRPRPFLRELHAASRGTLRARERNPSRRPAAIVTAAVARSPSRPAHPSGRLVECRQPTEGLAGARIGVAQASVRRVKALQHLVESIAAVHRSGPLLEAPGQLRRGGGQIADRLGGDLPGAGVSVASADPGRLDHLVLGPRCRGADLIVASRSKSVVSRLRGAGYRPLGAQQPVRELILGVKPLGLEARVEARREARERAVDLGPKARSCRPRAGDRGARRSRSDASWIARSSPATGRRRSAPSARRGRDLGGPPPARVARRARGGARSADSLSRRDRRSCRSDRSSPDLHLAGCSHPRLEYLPDQH